MDTTVCTDKVREAAPKEGEERRWRWRKKEVRKAGKKEGRSYGYIRIMHAIIFTVVRYVLSNPLPAASPDEEAAAFLRAFSLRTTQTIRHEIYSQEQRASIINYTL